MLLILTLTTTQRHLNSKSNYFRIMGIIGMTKSFSLSTPDKIRCTIDTKENLFDSWVPLHNFKGTIFLISMMDIMKSSERNTKQLDELMNSIGFWKDSKMPKTVSIDLYNWTILGICCRSLELFLQVHHSLEQECFAYGDTSSFCSIKPFFTLKTAGKKNQV